MNSPSDKPRWGSFGSLPLPGNSRRRTPSKESNLSGVVAAKAAASASRSAAESAAELIDWGIVNVVQHKDAARH